jgi:drug/metabolite transporter (DMT)-like permease
MTKSEALRPTSRPAMTPQAYAFILIGLIAISCASIFIRFAQDNGLPSLVIAAGRLTLAALVLTPVTLRQHRPLLRTLHRQDLLLAAASGVLLAIHFATWIASLEHTTVLVSVVLVASSPLWVALLEVVFLRARLRPIVVIGLLVALAGGVLIGVGGSGEFAAGRNPLLGGGLALIGALAIAVYFVIGRKLRARLPLVPYIWLVYGCAAITLLLAVLVTTTPVTGYPSEGYFWVVLLALVPQLIGHSSLNYALRYLSATYVSIATQMEPVGSAIAAFVLLRETPAALQIVGSLAILVGVLFASYGQQAQPATANAVAVTEP